MKREILVYDHEKNEMVPKGTETKTHHHYVISDHMDPLKNMASGKVHDSKSNFRADTKAHGCIELGNDSPTTNDRPTARQMMPDWRPRFAQELSKLNGR